jgi:DNA-binding NarL/FixJ family response regulator
VNIEPQATASPSSAPIKVGVIEDQRRFREALSAMIDGTEGFRCTGGFRTMEEALDKIGRDLPNVALVDIGLPGMSGIEGISILKQRYPNLVLVGELTYETSTQSSAWFRSYFYCSGVCQSVSWSILQRGL